MLQCGCVHVYCLNCFLCDYIIFTIIVLISFVTCYDKRDHWGSFSNNMGKMWKKSLFFNLVHCLEDSDFWLHFDIIIFIPLYVFRTHKTVSKTQFPWKIPNGPFSHSRSLFFCTNSANLLVLHNVLCNPKLSWGILLPFT